MKSNSYKFEDWGLVPYADALDRQLHSLEKIHEEQHPGTIVFCTHPPVVTCGRSTTSDDLLGWAGETFEVSRGGRATYHGPSQLVVYPLINLKRASDHRASGEVVGFLRQLENSIIAALSDLHIPAIGRSLQKKSDETSTSDETGVWVSLNNGKSFDRKIASLGIAVKKWITYHGAAINLYEDTQAFAGIRPCGFQTNVMISLQSCLELQNRKLNLEIEQDFRTKLRSHLLELL